MKLLIVDDEKLTREGIRDSLGLESLGISQVLLEDDGIHGLKTALEERPDIVLTDVRMPRMNGVQMAERILKELPGTSIIFYERLFRQGIPESRYQTEGFGICGKTP